jgi:DNA-binding transcriptional LysR family regulator
MNPPSLPLRNLDLNLLKVFDVVMVERNVTRAALRLSMTQPAVSNALRRLRESTRQDLFVPHASGVTPTQAAQALWPVVRESLERLRGALEAQDFDPCAEDRSFTVTMADATAALFVPVLLKALQQQKARVSLNFVPLTTRDPRVALEHSLADVAVGFFPEVAAVLDSDGPASAMRRQSLYSCNYTCVMRRGHRLARPGALTLDAFCAAQQLRVNFAGRPRGFVDEELARLGRERRIVITVNEFFTAGAVVQGSDLLSVLPRSFVPATGFQQRLVMRTPPLNLPSIEVDMLWHGRHDSNPAQRWLRQTLAQAGAKVAGQVAAQLETTSAAARAGAAS